MYCPLCNARTEVSEKRGIFRDRHCTNAACGVSFTTRESVIAPGERQRLCARTRDAQIANPPRSAAVGANGRPNPGAGSSAHSRRGEGATAAWQGMSAPRAVGA